MAALAASEARDLKARVADFARQKLFQERALDRLKANVADLETSAQQQEVIVGRQREAVERSSLSFAKGVSPVMRAEEENRALAALSSQFQETTARLVAARKERDEAARGWSASWRSAASASSARARTPSWTSSAFAAR
ncbi:hypothetical protein ACFQFG_17175 [Methylobacterium persicinum]